MCPLLRGTEILNPKKRKSRTKKTNIPSLMLFNYFGLDSTVRKFLFLAEIVVM